MRLVETLVVAGILATPAAHAAVIAESVPIYLSGYDDEQFHAYELPSFDPALGTLNSATFDIKGSIVPSIYFDYPRIPALLPGTNNFLATESAQAATAFGVPPGSSHNFFQRSALDTLTLVGPSAIDPMSYHSIGGSGYFFGSGFQFDFTGGIALIDAVKYVGGDHLEVDFGGGSNPTNPQGEYYDASDVRAVYTLAFEYTPVPEPASAALLAAGVIGLLAGARPSRLASIARRQFIRGAALQNGMGAKSLMTAGLVLAFAVASPGIAAARGASSGRSSATTFRTSECKTDACMAKHPSGEYVHPITPRRRR